MTKEITEETGKVNALFTIITKSSSVARNGPPKIVA